jgi:hypothetical protein
VDRKQTNIHFGNFYFIESSFLYKISPNILENRKKQGKEKGGRQAVIFFFPSLPSPSLLPPSPLCSGDKEVEEVRGGGREGRRVGGWKHKTVFSSSGLFFVPPVLKRQGSQGSGGRRGGGREGGRGRGGRRKGTHNMIFSSFGLFFVPPVLR